ncbi:MAG TPA: hypothetical protein VM580_31560 [Labilithrix sp.]|nr:hypothetical protein [Labilithrix sp.]
MKRLEMERETFKKSDLGFNGSSQHVFGLSRLGDLEGPPQVFFHPSVFRGRLFEGKRNGFDLVA